MCLPVVIVTGAGGFIGRAIAADPLYADVSNRAVVEETVQKTLDRFGKIDAPSAGDTRFTLGSH